MLSLGSFLFGQGMTFAEGTFSDALARAKKENKLIFLDAYASWCGPCKLMAKNVFTQEEVGQFYNANFINTKIDMEKGEGVALAKKYGVMAYPTYLYLNADGELLHRGTGYYDPGAFIGVGKEATDPAKQMGALKKRFDAGDNDPEFLRSFLKVYTYTDRELATKAGVRYFEAIKSQPLTMEDLNYLFSIMSDSTSPLYPYWEMRKPDILQLLPEASYNQIDKKLRTSAVMVKSYDKNTKVFNEKIFAEEAGKLMTPAEVKVALAKTKINIAKSEKNVPAFVKAAMDYYKDGNSENFSADELNSIAWDFFEKTDDKNALKAALQWANASVSKEAQYYNTDTLANLYYKTGDKKNAKIWAEKSIELAKKSNEDYESTQELLDKLK